MNCQGIRLKTLLMGLFIMVVALSCDHLGHLRVEEDFVHLNEHHKILKADIYDL